MAGQMGAQPGHSQSVRMGKTGPNLKSIKTIGFPPIHRRNDMTVLPAARKHLAEYQKNEGGGRGGF